MLKHLMTSTALAALLLAGPAIAQNDTKEMNKDAAQSMQMQDKAGASDQMKSDHMKSDQMKSEDMKSGKQDTAATKMESDQASTGTLAFVGEQKATDWSVTENLIGASVENSQGESLGDINDIILDENGSISAVVIGVGGFLGIGEKNVGVPFSALEFKTEADIAANRPLNTGDRTGSTGYSDRTAAGQPPANNLEQKADRLEERADKLEERADKLEEQADNRDDQAAPQQMAERREEMKETADQRLAATPTQQGTSPVVNQRLGETDRQQTLEEEKDNLVIVLNTTREQLENAPTFLYVGEERDEDEADVPAENQARDGAEQKPASE